MNQMRFIYPEFEAVFNRLASFRDKSDHSATFFMWRGQPQHLFNSNLVFRAGNFRCQQDMTSDHRSRRRGRWPLDHHRGPTLGHLVHTTNWNQVFGVDILIPILPDADKSYLQSWAPVTLLSTSSLSLVVAQARSGTLSWAISPCRDSSMFRLRDSGNELMTSSVSRISSRSGNRLAGT